MHKRPFDSFGLYEFNMQEIVKKGLKINEIKIKLG